MLLGNDNYSIVWLAVPVGAVAPSHNRKEE